MAKKVGKKEAGKKKAVKKGGAKRAVGKAAVKHVGGFTAFAGLVTVPGGEIHQKLGTLMVELVMNTNVLEAFRTDPVALLTSRGFTKEAQQKILAGAITTVDGFYAISDQNPGGARMFDNDPFDPASRTRPDIG